MSKHALFVVGFLFSNFLVGQGFSEPNLPSDTDPAKEETDNLVVRKTYVTLGISPESAPVIDGAISDAVWEQVAWGGDYIEFQPDENTDPSVDTEFKILYDPRNLYIAFRCHDPEPDKIERRLSRRDGFAGDWVQVNIDSYNDKRTAFSFSISAAGVKGDEFISNNGNNWDSSWNPIWYAKTQIDSAGWTAEIRIPLSQLKFSDAPEQVWGLQSTRRFFSNWKFSLTRSLKAGVLSLRKEILLKMEVI